MKILPILLAVTAMASAQPALACSGCGCSLTSDWLSQGLVAQPGTTASLRYDYVPQTTLRTGNRDVTAAEKALPAAREIERYTYNHYAIASLDHQFASDWGLNMQAPYSYRPHSTFAEDETDASYSRSQGLGDVRITARWQGFKTPGCITGVQFGLVLPTGQFRQVFRSGPVAGEAVDRGLQPGTGTVQMAIGAYMYGKLTTNFDYILQFQGQAPINSRDLYKPGAAGQISAGVQYTHWRGITPQLGLNLRVSARDSGINSDRENSGGEQFYIVPGLIVGLGSRASLFVIGQVPLYQRVGGYQLTPGFTATTGFQLRLG